MGERLQKENKVTRRVTKWGETGTDQMKTTKVTGESIVRKIHPEITVPTWNGVSKNASRYNRRNTGNDKTLGEDIYNAYFEVAD